jgi:hypothetical protein
MGDNMKIQFIAMVSLLSVMGCGDDDAATTGTTTSPTTTMTTETGTTTATETGTTMTTETGTTMTTETGTTTTTSTTSKFSPVEGVWRVTLIDFAKNGCNLGDDGEPFRLRLTNIDASSFSLRDVEDPELNFDCTNTGSLKAYACTSVVMSDPIKPLDAFLNTSITPEVLFSSDSAAEMPFEFMAECVGSDCAKVEAMLGKDIPCLTEATFALQVVGS